MKQVLLIRHAKSSWDDPHLEDKMRPLNPRGKRDAPYMAAYIKSLGYNISHIYSSPAKRAHRTAEHFALEHQNIDISIETDLYFGREEDWLFLINSLEESVSLPAYFSHNPTITYFSNQFSESLIDNVPTTGIVVLQSSAENWKDLHPDNTKVKNTYFPKLVRKDSSI